MYLNIAPVFCTIEMTENKSFIKLRNTGLHKNGSSLMVHHKPQNKKKNLILQHCIFTYISIFCREKRRRFHLLFCGFFVTFLSFSRTNHTMSTSSLLKTITIQNSLMITCHTGGFKDRKLHAFSTSRSKS